MPDSSEELMPSFAALPTLGVTYLDLVCGAVAGVGRISAQ